MQKNLVIRVLLGHNKLHEKVILYFISPRTGSKVCITLFRRIRVLLETQQNVGPNVIELVTELILFCGPEQI